MSEVFDLVVIGGGPAGYVGAIRAAQLGLKVICVERDALGGTCLNWGCIPTKALIAGAEMYHQVKHEAAKWGITTGEVSYDWSKIIGRSRTVAGNLNKGIGFLFKKNKITHVMGHAHISNPKMGCCDGAERKFEIAVYDAADSARAGAVKQTITAKNILICTGAGPRELPGTPFDGDKVISSKQAMNLPEQPKSLLVLGSGAIGMEFAYFYNAFGTKVTVVEMQDRVLPIEDNDVSKVVEKAFTKSGITILTNHTTKAIEKTATGIKAVVAKADGSGEQTIEADKLLVAIGVAGRYDGLFDDSLGIKTERGFIVTDYKQEHPKYATSVPGIYAVGDIIGPPWLAHVASEEAVTCVERIFGAHAHDVDYSSIPGCTYCEPQVASIGLTERACKEQNLDIVIGTFPLAASGKAQAMGSTDGFVKMISDKKTGEILGCHMVGHGVTELIAEIGLARKLEATVDEVIATMHAHPTLSEGVHEAALGTAGRMVHA